jgi:cobalt-zinc-cadmium efflux system outer membrane protein
MTVGKWSIRFVLWLTLAVLEVRTQTPLTLKQAIITAKANNPVLKTEIYNVSFAEADIITSRLRPNPILNNQSLQLADPRYFAPGISYLDNRNRQIWWQMVKTFQLPAQRKYKIETARKHLMLNEDEFNETTRNVFLEVADKWLNVWTAKKQLELLQQAKTNSDSLVNVNKQRVKNQQITQTELIRTELMSTQYALQIKITQQEYNTELENLRFLLGVQEEIVVDTTDSFAFAIPMSVDSLLQEALIKRTDIRVLKSTIDVANSNIRLQKALAWPSPELGVIYNPQNTVPYLGVYGTIQIPIFSRNQGEIKKSYLLKQQSEQGLIKVQQHIRVALTTAFVNYQAQKINLQNFRDLLREAGEILISVEHSYLKGNTSVVDYLEEHRSWVETRQQYFDVLRSYRRTYVELLYTSGLINQIAE